MKVTEHRFISMDNIRQMCIDHNWCDEMTIGQYDALLTKYHYLPLRTIDVLEMAQKIANGSTECDVNDRECLENIMFEIAKYSYTTFDIEEEE